MSFRVLAATEPADFDWFFARSGMAPDNRSPAMRGVKAVDEQGNTKGMIVYNNWSDNSVQVHMAVDSPIAWRAMLRPIFHYAFVQCGKGVLIATNARSNAAAQKMTEHLGFRLCYVVRDGSSVGDDLTIWEMRREECHWLGDNV